MSKYIRAKSVAEYLDVSEASVWRYVQQGILPKPINVTPRTTLWRTADIDDAIEKIALNGGQS
jgi:predicted DNA-binding transcriptional regulator AlpA